MVNWEHSNAQPLLHNRWNHHQAEIRLTTWNSTANMEGLKTMKGEAWMSYNIVETWGTNLLKEEPKWTSKFHPYRSLSSLFIYFFQNKSSLITFVPHRKEVPFHSYPLFSTHLSSRLCALCFARIWYLIKHITINLLLRFLLRFTSFPLLLMVYYLNTTIKSFGKLSRKS